MTNYISVNEADKHFDFGNLASIFAHLVSNYRLRICYESYEQDHGFIIISFEGRIFIATATAFKLSRSKTKKLRNTTHIVICVDNSPNR